MKEPNFDTNSNDDDCLLVQLLSDHKMSSEQKRQLITSSGSEANFRRELIDAPEHYLPLLIDLLSMADYEDRGKLIEWLSPSFKGLPARWQDRLREALWQLMNTFGRGFQHYLLLEEADDALSRLLQDPTIPQENVGAILLADAPDHFLQSLTAGNPYSAVPYIIEALVHPDWQIRVLAARWLSENGAGLPPDLYDLCLESLEQRLLTDSNIDMRLAAEQGFATLVRNRQSGISARQGELARLIADNQLDDVGRIRALESLARMETREASELIVRQWLDWLCAEGQSAMICQVERLLRLDPLAIHPLLDQLREKVHTPDEVDQASDVEKRRFCQRHIFRLISEMSSDSTQENAGAPRGSMVAVLLEQAVPVLSALLPEVTDQTSREFVVRTLANLGGSQPAAAIIREFLDQERQRNIRHELLKTYYLQPAATREKQAAQILDEAIADAKRTLRILQGLNISAFVAGLLVVAIGLTGVFLGDDVSSRILGLIAALGAQGSLLYQLIHSPMERIEESLAFMVRLETAFTGFVWILNLNSTYIQSLYIMEGNLDEETMHRATERIEQAAELVVALSNNSREINSNAQPPLVKATLASPK